MLWFSRELKWAIGFDALSGKAAVVGFLVISGYSIGASMDRSETGFYRRRFLRIYPLYFFAILFAVVLEVSSGGHVHLPNQNVDSLGWTSWLGNFLLLQTFLVKPIQFDGPVWSLSIEVFFYILAPYFKRVPSRYLVSLIAFSGVCFLLPKHYDWGAVYWALSKFNALEYLWCWLLGFLLWRQSGTLVYVCLVGGGVLVYFGSATPEPFSCVTYLLTVALIVNSRRITMPKQLLMAGEYLGDISYPLYLFHLPGMIFVYLILGMRSWFALVASAITISVVAYHLIDRNLKRRFLTPLFFPRPKSTAPLESVA